MGLLVMKGLTPHLEAVDLQRLRGITVLGEPLPLLMSASLRLRLVSVHEGLATIAGTLADDEVAALRRAMHRVALRPDGDQGDAARLVSVVRQACEAADFAVARILARPA